MGGELVLPEGNIKHNMQKLWKIHHCNLFTGWDWHSQLLIILTHGSSSSFEGLVPSPSTFPFLAELELGSWSWPDRRLVIISSGWFRKPSCEPTRIQAIILCTLRQKHNAELQHFPHVKESGLQPLNFNPPPWKQKAACSRWISRSPWKRLAAAEFHGP